MKVFDGLDYFFTAHTSRALKTEFTQAQLMLPHIICQWLMLDKMTVELQLTGESHLIFKLYFRLEYLQHSTLSSKVPIFFKKRNK